MIPCWSFRLPIGALVSRREKKQEYSKSFIAVRALDLVVSASVCRFRDNWSRRRAGGWLRRPVRAAVRFFPFVYLSANQCDFLLGNLCRQEKLWRRMDPPLSLQRRGFYLLNESRRANH